MRGSPAIRGLAVVFLGAAGIWAGSALGGVRTHDRITPTAAEYLPGHYQGYIDSFRANTIGTVSMTLTAEQSRLLGGALTIGGTTVPVQVASAPGGAFTAFGTGRPGFLSVGRVSGFGDGSLLSTSWYLMLGAGRGIDTGSLRLLRSFPDSTEAPQLPASMAGSLVRDDGQTGQLGLDLSQRGTSFSGTAQFGEMSFPFLGTIGAGQAPEPVHAISVSSLATIDIDATYSAGDAVAPQPHMDGTVTATFTDGSVHTATFTLVPAAPADAG